MVVIILGCMYTLSPANNKLINIKKVRVVSHHDYDCEITQCTRARFMYCLIYSITVLLSHCCIVAIIDLYASTQFILDFIYMQLY